MIKTLKKITGVVDPIGVGIQRRVDPDGSKYGHIMDPMGLLYDPNAYQGPGISYGDSLGSITVNPAQAFEGKQGASDLLGQLNRAQWEDWKRRYRPRIQALIDTATDAEAGDRAARLASSSMGQAFDSSARSAEHNRRSLGVQLTPREQAEQDRIHKVSRAAASVSAGNEARMAAQDRQQMVLAGGMGLSNIPDEVMN